ncbi:MAG TPA: cytochrome c oxidase assembly protein [Candidatus Nitrosotenuis sp.]|nr:cytochrome c oxidase assembly protein [Candidatus Nitrosotenuis sp.]
MFLAHIPELVWKFEPGLIDAMAVILAFYALVAGPLRRWWAPQEAFPARQAFYFGLGMLVLYVAVQSPLDELGEKYSFTAHMFQHNLLMYTVPCLLLWGVPAWMLRPLLSMEWSSGLWRVLTRPVVAGVLFTAVFSLWHVPALYDTALRDRLVHNLEHLMFLGSALLAWWPVYSPMPEFPRLSHAGQMVYAFLLALAQTPVFALLTFSREPWYPTYETAVRIWGLTPLEDQQVGGILMKVLGMAVFGWVMARAFWRWYHEENRRRPAHQAIR